MKVKLVFLMNAVMAACSFGAVPVFYDDFDSLYSVGQGFTSLTNRWQASGSSAVIANSGAYSNYCVEMTGGVTLTNTVAAEAGLKVWTDLRIKPFLGEVPDSPPTNVSSFLFYFATNGYVMLSAPSEPSGWRVCTNDVWGNAVPPATNANVYVRVSVVQDYATSNQAMFLDGRLLVQNQPFAVAAGRYDRLGIQNSSTKCWLDNVWISTNYDDASLTNSYNDDGVSDIEEVDRYGYARRTLYVCTAQTNLVPVFTSITNALANWRPRDVVHVIAGDYSAEQVTIPANPSNVVFEGADFTVSSLSVPPVSSVSFSQSVSCVTLSLTGQVALASGFSLTATTAQVEGVLTVPAPGGLVATTLSVGPAGTVTAGTTAQTVTMAGSAVIRGAVTLSGALTVASGAAASIDGAVNCASVDLLGDTVFGSSLTSAGALIVQAGATITCSNQVNCGSLAATGNVTLVNGSAMTSGVAYVGGTLTVPGGFVATDVRVATAGAVNAVMTAQTLAMDGSAAIHGTVTLSGALTVASGAAASIDGAVNCADVDLSGDTVFGSFLTSAGALIVQAGTDVTCSNGVNCGSLAATGSVTLVNGAAMTSGVSYVGGTLTVPGGFVATDVTVGPGGTVNAETTAQTVTMSGASAFGGAVTLTGALTVNAGAAATFAQTVNCATLSLAGQATMASGAVMTSTTANVTGSFGVSGGGALVVTALDLSPAGSITSTSARVVAVAANVTLDGTFVLTGTTLGATFGDIVLSGNVAVSGSNFSVNNLVVAAGASVSFAQSFISGSLSVTGQVAMANGTSVTSTTAQVEGLISVSTNGVFYVTQLDINHAGKVTFTTNAMLQAIATGVTVEGPFTISNTWSTADRVSMPLAFNDTFDSYGLNTPVTSLKFRGWYASDASVHIQGAAQSGKAAVLPDGTVMSNSVYTTEKKIWTDFYLRPMLGDVPDNPPTNTAAFVGYVNRDGFLVVWEPGGWNVCSNKLNGYPATRMRIDTFTRISVFNDLNEHTFAVFVDGDLVAQGMQSPAQVPAYTEFGVCNRSGWQSPAYVDEVSILATLPPTLTKDLDLDLWYDSYEVMEVGLTTAWPPRPEGAVYRFR